MAAGSIGSPQIMMLSGLGPAAQLAQFECGHDQPSARCAAISARYQWALALGVWTWVA